MPGRIPQSFIDDVINQTDIVELINGYVELKVKGKEHVACCPFHHEKTPSFTVSADKQFYHCFGCGAHGTAVGFLMEKEGLSFIETIETLAHRLGMPLPDAVQGAHNEHKHSDMYAALTAASEFYYQQLCNTPHAQDYLKSRGISGHTAKAFALGYAPDSFNHLNESVNKSFSNKALLESGLQAKNNKGQVYDRFRNRLMFPIRDYRGRIVGFGGRVLDQSLPKYLNSPETTIFHKNQTLYGLYEARQALGRFNRVIIVEGYMDVIALAQHDIRNALATLGTATTAQHIKALLRFASEFVFCFDGDEAGRKAAWKAMTQVLPEFKDGIDVRFMFLPQGEDPDSFIRAHGPEYFLQAIEKATPLAEYFFDEIGFNRAHQEPGLLAKLAAQAKPLLSTIPNGIFKTLMFNELEKRIGTRVLSPAPSPNSQSRKSRTKHSLHNTRYTKVRLAIALLLREPGLHSHALPLEELETLSDQAGIPLLIQMLQFLDEDPTLTTPSLLERFQDTPWFEHLQKLLAWENPDMANREASFKDTMQAFAREITHKSWDELIHSGNLNLNSDSNNKH